MSRFVSTGQLPSPERVQALVDGAHSRFAGERSGEVSGVYPALHEADPNLFGIQVAGVTGNLYAAGDCDVEFTIMSVAKPFVFAVVCDAVGPEVVQAKVGVNATGMAFNSIESVGAHGDGRTNPMVNPGAIATTSLVPGDTTDDKWGTLLLTLSSFAGRELTVHEEVYASATTTNIRNREIVGELVSHGAIYFDPADTLDLYTRLCCLAVTAGDLAIMGATLANGGVNPHTGETVVGEVSCRHTLSVMATAGMYETSGDWLYEIGLPAKSGIGGGIVTVSPGKGGLGVFSPPLDEAGNSVRGKKVARYLSSELGLDLFVSAPRDQRN